MTEQPWQRRQLAGFWLRVAAVLVDVVLAVVVFAALVLLTRPVLETITGAEPDTILVVAIALGVLALGALLYDVLMTAGAGGTLGKRATGLEVRDDDGQRIEVGQALGRSLARVVSVVVVLLGVLWVTWDRRKQGWHDKLVRTVVVKRRHLPLALRDPEAPWWASAAPAALPAGTPVAGDEAPTAGAAAMSWATPAADPAVAGSSAGARAVGEDEPADTRWAPSRAGTDVYEAEPAPSRPVAPAHGREEPPGEPAEGEPGEGEPASALDAGAEDDALAVAGYASSRASGSAPDAAASGPAEAASPETSAFRELFDDGPGGRSAGSQAAGSRAAGGQAPPQGREPADADASGPAEVDADASGPAEADADASGPAEDDADASGPAEADTDLAPETDPNLVAIQHAGLAEDAAQWLRQVGAQVDPRLDQVSASWRQQEQAPAARACAFGLLLGHLASLYPHMADDLHEVAEAHPSFSTLMAGSRLATLQQIAGDRARMAAWLGPLLGVSDEQRVARLLQ